jgi:hypothetical protein
MGNCLRYMFLLLADIFLRGFKGGFHCGIAPLREARFHAKARGRKD